MRVIPFKPDAKLNYSLALEKIQNKDYGFAIKLLKEAIQIDAKPEYYVELAELYFTLGEYFECMCVYNRMARDKGYKLDVVLGMLRAHCALRELPFCSDYLNINHAATWRIFNKFYDVQKLKDICVECKENTDALKAPHMIDVKDNAIKRKIAMAEDYCFNANFSSALSLIEDIPSSSKYYVASLELKTSIYLDSGDLEQALEIAKELKSISKGNLQAICAILIILYNLGDTKFSVDFRNAYIECEQEIFESGNAKALVRFINLTQALGYTAGLNRVLKKAIKAFPYNSQIIFYVIENHIARDEYDRAKELIAKARELFPNHPLSSAYNYLINDERFIKKCDRCIWDGFTFYQGVRTALSELRASEFFNENCDVNAPLNEDLLTYLLYDCDAETVEDVLSDKRLQQRPGFKEFLIRALDNQYLNYETRYVLLAALHNVQFGTGALLLNSSGQELLNVMYFVPDKAPNKDLRMGRLISKVYACLVYDYNVNTDNVNKESLAKEYKYLNDLNVQCKEVGFCAALHFRYLTKVKGLKNNELLKKSVSDFYDIWPNDLDEVLKAFNLI